MGNLLSSLLGAANTLDVYDRQLTAIQNNVSNASTPGYVRQTQTVVAKRLDIDHGLPGGVEAGPLVSARSEFAEQNVRTQFSQLGFVEQKANDLTGLESLFNLQSDSGVSGAISGLFASFSQLSVNPNDGLARQAVLDSAGQLAATVNQTAADLANLGAQAGTQMRDIVSTINQLGGQLRDLNETYRQNFQSRQDAGLDASIHSTLEELSEYAGFTTTREADGTTSVYLGGQIPLVVGDRIFPLSTDLSSSQAAVLDSTGSDVTGKITSGKLAGAIQEKNELIPSYLDQLNTLASTLADQVNQKLSAGVDANGAAPSTDLFTYDASAGAALSLSVTGITPDQIAAATPDAPGGNSNALDLAALNDQKSLNGYTFVGFFGNLGGENRPGHLNGQQRQSVPTVVSGAGAQPARTDLGSFH